MLRVLGCLLGGLLAGQGLAATRLLVTVVERKGARPVGGLSASDFTVSDDGGPRRVEAVEVSSSLMDVMLLLDTSLAGDMVQPVADNLIEQLQPKDQMAVVSYHSSADLIQDFTSSRELLRKAIAGVRYGNVPHLLNALYAAVTGGFESSTFRRVVLVLTTGAEGPSRVTEREVVRAARRNGVSIYPVYMFGVERSLFESLARQTGGASMSLNDLRKALKGPPGPRIFEVLRTQYTLTLAGNLGLGERLKIEIKRPGKFFISALPLD